MTAANHQILYHPEPEICLDEDASPLKNPFCPYYGECLEGAVEAGWPQFTCVNCSYRDLQLHIMPDAIEMEGLYRLLAKIFRPGRYRSFDRRERVDVSGGTSSTLLAGNMA